MGHVGIRSDFGSPARLRHSIFWIFQEVCATAQFGPLGIDVSWKLIPAASKEYGTPGLHQRAHFRWKSRHSTCPSGFFFSRRTPRLVLTLSSSTDDSFTSPSAHPTYPLDSWPCQCPILFCISQSTLISTMLPCSSRVCGIITFTILSFLSLVALVTYHLQTARFHSLLYSTHVVRCFSFCSFCHHGVQLFLELIVDHFVDECAPQSCMRIIRTPPFAHVVCFFLCLVDVGCNAPTCQV